MAYLVEKVNLGQKDWQVFLVPLENQEHLDFLDFLD